MMDRTTSKALLFSIFVLLTSDGIGRVTCLASPSSSSSSLSASSTDAAASSTRRSVPMLTSTPEPAGSDKDDDVVSWFDTKCVANPVIVPPKSVLPPWGVATEPKDYDKGEEWKCYFYGHSGSWNGGYKPFLPTGASGLAISKDGLTSWKKIRGNEKDGAVLAPSPLSDEEGGGGGGGDSDSSPSSSSWDSVHTGVGDIVRVGENELHMYYLGAGDEETTVPGNDMIKGAVGLRMRIGRAVSKDDGVTWTKEGCVLDYDESEGLFASWPRIVPPKGDDKTWRMFYHAFDGVKWRVFSAESQDEGRTWKRTGLVLEGNGNEEDDAFDFMGIGTRSVVRWRDGLLMIFEGVDKTGVHRLGAAYCPDEASSTRGSENWTKLNDGNPILEPGKPPLGEWTNLVIGTPYVVPMPDGSLRLYHCSCSHEGDKMAIGVVVSKSGDVLPECWTAIP